MGKGLKQSLKTVLNAMAQMGIYAPELQFRLEDYVEILGEHGVEHRFDPAPLPDRGHVLSYRGVYGETRIVPRKEATP